MKKTLLFIACALVIAFGGCKKKATSTTTSHKPMLIFKFVFDPNQERLNGLGQPAPMAAGHAGQNPAMNVMAAHYIEMTTDDYTPVGSGVRLYNTPMTTLGGASAIDFQQEKFTQNDSVFFQIPLDSVASGNYKWLRVSLAYQNYTVQMLIDSTYNYGGYTIPINQEFPSTIASFVGVNSYITTYKINTQSVTVNGNRAQGYWGFETNINYNGYNQVYKSDGQSPDSATTVVNPLHDSSPIPKGSCLVTGQFNGTGGAPLSITGKETNDIVVTVSLSINHSFEWVEVVNDGKWEPLKGEYIVDMGIRGMKPTVQY